MKNLVGVLRRVPMAYVMPFSTKFAVWMFIGWSAYVCFIAWMMWFNKYVTNAASWFSFATNLACLIWGFTVLYWLTKGLRYRLFIRGMTRSLDPAMKAVMGQEHGLAKVRYGFHDRKPGLFLGDCSCGCGASVLIDAENHTLNILSKEVQDKIAHDHSD